MASQYSADVSDISLAISPFSGATSTVSGTGLAIPPSLYRQEFQDQRVPNRLYPAADDIWINHVPASDVALSNNTQERLPPSNQWSSQLNAAADMYDYDLSYLDDLSPSSLCPASSSVENDVYPSDKAMSSKVHSKLSNYTSGIQPATLMQEMTPGWLRKNDPSTAAMVEGGDGVGNDQEAPQLPPPLNAQNSGLLLSNGADHVVPEWQPSAKGKLLLATDQLRLGVVKGDVTGNRNVLYWLSEGRNAQVHNILTKQKQIWNKKLRSILKIAFDGSTLSQSCCVGRSHARNIPLDAKKLTIIKDQIFIHCGENEKIKDADFTEVVNSCCGNARRNAKKRKAKKDAFTEEVNNSCGNARQKAKKDSSRKAKKDS